MLWLYTAIAAYFLFAISSVADRYLLAGPLPNPRIYAFYAGILGVFAFALAPFGFRVPDGFVLLLALSAGAVNIIALFLFYRAVFHGHVSTVVPGIGALVPLFTLLFTMLLGEPIALAPRGIAALLFLIAGTVLLSTHFKRGVITFSYGNIANMLYASIAFGLSFTLTKLVFVYEPFISGFIWMALGGSFFSAIFLLVQPQMRLRVAKRHAITHLNVGLPFLVGKGAGAIGSFLQNYAIFLATTVQVTFISALSGVQYFFLLLFVVLFAFKNPRILKEEVTVRNLSSRLFGIVAISVGIYLLVL